jgi:hypothetical protein
LKSPSNLSLLFPKRILQEKEEEKQFQKKRGKKKRGPTRHCSPPSPSFFCCLLRSTAAHPGQPRRTPDGWDDDGTPSLCCCPIKLVCNPSPYQFPLQRRRSVPLSTPIFCSLPRESHTLLVRSPPSSIAPAGRVPGRRRELPTLNPERVTTSIPLPRRPQALPPFPSSAPSAPVATPWRPLLAVPRSAALHPRRSCCPVSSRPRPSYAAPASTSPLVVVLQADVSGRTASACPLYIALTSSLQGLRPRQLARPVRLPCSSFVYVCCVVANTPASQRLSSSR